LPFSVIVVWCGMSKLRGVWSALAIHDNKVIALPKLNHIAMEIYHFIVEIFQHSLAKGCPSMKGGTFSLHESHDSTSAHFQVCATDASFCC
jgi:hypothetical protein